MEWNKLKFEGTSLQDLSLVRQKGKVKLVWILFHTYIHASMEATEFKNAMSPYHCKCCSNKMTMWSFSFNGFSEGFGKLTSTFIRLKPGTETKHLHSAVVRKRHKNIKWQKKLQNQLDKDTVMVSVKIPDPSVTQTTTHPNVTYWGLTTNQLTLY